MTDNFDTSWFLIVSAYSVENFMMGEDIVTFYWWCVIGIPSFEKGIVVLKLKLGNGGTGTSF
jgi:hypothetical protein